MSRQPSAARLRVETLEERHLPSTFAVTNTNDSGAGSLRQAILEANDTARHPGLDTITFNIPGTGVHAIQPLSALPEITDPIVIDGYTQPGASSATATTNATLRVVLDGSMVSGVSRTGLEVAAGDSTIRGLVINRFPFIGILLRTRGRNVVEGNFIGIDSTGTSARGNYQGVDIRSSSGNCIGGTAPAARNIISGNAAYHIGVTREPGSPDSVGNLIQGNYVGTDVTRMIAIDPPESALRNVTGVCLGQGAVDTVVGGTAAGAGNLLSGNFDGLSLWRTTGTVVQGNLIGTDVTGTRALGNVDGIHIDSTTNTLIGGTAVGAGNVISGNIYSGFWIQDLSGSYSNTAVQGNFIGTDRSGTLDLGNWTRGIALVTGVGYTIGGIANGAGNVIAYNGFQTPYIGSGIWVHVGSDNAILSNRIFSNKDLGIDLVTYPSNIGLVTPSDPAIQTREGETTSRTSPC